MKLPIFTTFLIFILWLTYELKKHSNDDREARKSFWARELEANSTRKKPIDQLPYISIPLSDFSLDFPVNDEKITEYRDTLRLLAEKKILNLTGYSNTDLKLEYGAPNITALTAYDQNFTVLVRTIAQLAEKYLALGYSSEARTLLEFGISVGSDVRKNYELLATLYKENGEFSKIETLFGEAEKLKSLSKDPILRFLNSIMPELDSHK